MQGIVRYLTVEMALVKSSSNLEVVGSNTALHKFTFYKAIHFNELRVSNLVVKPFRKRCIRKYQLTVRPTTLT